MSSGASDTTQVGPRIKVASSLLHGLATPEGIFTISPGKAPTLTATVPLISRQAVVPAFREAAREELPSCAFHVMEANILLNSGEANVAGWRMARKCVFSLNRKP